LDDESLAALAKKTFILATTVGPFFHYGEHAFKACAENGTHYLDVTGEVPWTFKMIKKYEEAAKASGAIMVPQIGVESAPPDLLTWSLASLLRTKMSAKTGDVIISIHRLKYVCEARSPFQFMLMQFSLISLRLLTLPKMGTLRRHPRHGTRAL
jgi:short subunit dehydrogenase-like uncharacterized protein